MIIRELNAEVDALELAFYRDSDHLILDIDEGLDVTYFCYAWYKCMACGGHAHVTLDTSLPERCLCRGKLVGYIADMVVQGDKVLYSHERAS